MSCIYTKQELYELNWEKPIRTIAKEIGVSDSVLGKAYRQAGITRSEQADMIDPINNLSFLI